MDKEAFYYPLPARFTAILSKFDVIDELQPPEAQIILLLTYAVFAVGTLVFFILMFVPAVYGRYAGPKSWFGFGVNARTAWFIQEFPSFIFPVVFCLLEYNRKDTISICHVVLIGLFTLHYWER